MVMRFSGPSPSRGRHHGRQQSTCRDEWTALIWVRSRCLMKGLPPLGSGAGAAMKGLSLHLVRRFIEGRSPLASQFPVDGSPGGLAVGGLDVMVGLEVDVGCSLKVELDVGGPLGLTEGETDVDGVGVSEGASPTTAKPWGWRATEPPTPPSTSFPVRS